MIFKTNKLKVGYKDKIIVDNINIDINMGEVLCILGQNGCGKSTILKTITRHIESLDGNISIIDKDLFKLNNKELAKKISVVLTDRISPKMVTGKDIVATGRYPYTNHLGRLEYEDLRIINESIAMVNGEELKDKEFRFLSDGEKQRIMIARAICQESDIMILDEPTSFLDIRYKIELLSILNQLSLKKNITIIMSLHEIDLVTKIADKVILIKNHEIYKQGCPEEVIKDEYIHHAYDISSGSYNSQIGYIELPKTESKVEVFIIAGEGKGAKFYRALNKQGIGFYTGVIGENDVDYQVARSLSNKTIKSKSFMEATDNELEEAKELIDRSTVVLNTGQSFLGINKRNKELIQYALENKIPVINYDINDSFPNFIEEIKNILISNETVK